MRALRESGTCEIGAHHHAWETPPASETDRAGHAYASTLPVAQFEAQLAPLTDAITDAVGERPRAYRSGRFGFAAEHVQPLERAGYTVESSVAPLFCESHKGGPDFADAPLTPYFLAYDDAARAGTSQLLEVPVSCGLQPRRAARAAGGVDTRPEAVHDPAGAEEARRRAPDVVAPLVFVA